MKRFRCAAVRVRLACACVLVAGCAPTVISGTAVKASDPADGAIVELMDTGPYSVAAGHPLGTAGSDTALAATLEAHRLGEYVTGPWEVSAQISSRGVLDDTLATGPIPDPDALPISRVATDAQLAVAAAHHYITGFASERIAGPATGPRQLLQNAVLRFPDPTEAAAAAAEMAAAAPPPMSSAPPRPMTIERHPEAIASTWDNLDNQQVVASFTTLGPHVLYQYAISGRDALPWTAAQMVASALDLQVGRLDQFAPTEAAKMGELAMDPTGRLAARTLWSRDLKSPAIVGIWSARAWLHFEDDPAAAAALFESAGVDVVAQRLTTVYQTRNAEAARHVVDFYTDAMTAMADAKSIGEVPGLPQARCFQRTGNEIPRNPPQSVLRIAWRYKCVAWADHYAFSAVSESDSDVKQQISAQYRILAGK